jgi:hypothetical protein
VIKYRLGCASGHEFDSWFRAGSDFDMQSRAGEVACPVCGSTDIVKLPMAPSIVTTRTAVQRSTADTLPVHSGEAKVALDALRAIKKNIVENSDDVGSRFAEEARKMHFGDVEERHIRGSSTLEEARNLAEDGVPFGILPALPEDLN